MAKTRKQQPRGQSSKTVTAKQSFKAAMGLPTTTQHIDEKQSFKDAVARSLLLDQIDVIISLIEHSTCLLEFGKVAQSRRFAEDANILLNKLAGSNAPQIHRAKEICAQLLDLTGLEHHETAIDPPESLTSTQGDTRGVTRTCRLH